MVVSKTEFPDGIHILMLPLPDDELCSVKGKIFKISFHLIIKYQDRIELEVKGKY